MDGKVSFASRTELYRELVPATPLPGPKLGLVLLRQLVGIAAHGEVLCDLPDDGRPEQISQEQVADKLHRREAAALLLALQEVQLLLVLALLLLLCDVERIPKDALWLPRRTPLGYV